MARSLMDRILNHKILVREKRNFKFKDFTNWWFNVVNGKSYKNVPKRIARKMHKLGFDSDCYVNYELDKNDYRDYITETERWKSRRLNGQFQVVLDDKRIFDALISPYVKTPKTLFFIENYVIKELGTNDKKTIDDIIEAIKEYKGVIFKPFSTGGGKYVMSVIYDGENFIVDSEKLTLEETIEKIKTQKDDIVTQYLFQHEYSNNIYPETLNTMRVITLQMKSGECVIPLAMHRFGTNESRPVDNACSGGIFTTIDVETGVLSYCKNYRTTDKYHTHPDTGAQIEGVVVPQWEEIKAKVIELANRLPYIKFIAWDVALTEDGIYIIEGNNSTGVGFFQMFKPERHSILGKFYEENGILKVDNK